MGAILAPKKHTSIDDRSHRDGIARRLADAIASIYDDDRTSLGDDEFCDGVSRGDDLDDDDDDDDDGRGARAIARINHQSPMRARDLYGEPTRDARQGGVSLNVTKRWCA